MLDSTRELFHLKSLSQLSVLDISSNPIGQTQQATRLFVIYHLTTLKALDGEAIVSIDTPSMAWGQVHDDAIIRSSPGVG